MLNKLFLVLKTPLGFIGMVLLVGGLGSEACIRYIEAHPPAKTPCSFYMDTPVRNVPVRCLKELGISLERNNNDLIGIPAVQ